MIYILFLLGFALLLKGAQYLVDGSASLAKKLGVPTLVIGLTIVAFGTSLPELVVNVISAFKGADAVAFGNIVGSNMANILLILGLSAVITNLKIQHSTVWKEIPFALLAVIALLLFSNIPLLDGLEIRSILRTEGLVLILFFIIFLYYVFALAKNHQFPVEKSPESIKEYSGFKIGMMIFGGLLALFFGGKWAVEGAIHIARLAGISEYLISITIVAVGTSLPELVTSVTAAFKKNMDIAVGNIIGSNIFNIFWVLGLTAVISPVEFPQGANMDILILTAATTLLFLFMFIGKKHELERWQGLVFIGLYGAYLGFLILRG